MHSKLLFCVMLLLIALPRIATATQSTCPEQKPTTETLSKQLDQGDAAFEAGDLTTAEARWTEIRECAPGSSEWPKAVFNLGLFEYKRNNFPQAIRYFDLVLQSHPDDKEAGGSLMETNRNYSNRSAMAISQCYEAMGKFIPALHYAWLAKTKYPYYSWCGTCYGSANFKINKRVTYLAMRVSRIHIWAALIVLGFVASRWKKPSRNLTASS